MNLLPSHSFNIVLAPDILEKLLTVQKKLKDRFTELRNYDSTPHLSVATKFMEPAEVGKILEPLKREFSNDHAWELKFTGFSRSKGGNYIFLNVSDESIEVITQLHNRVLVATKNIGFETQNNLPEKYPYNPHISIMKLGDGDIDSALEQINGDLQNLQMTVHKYELTSQQIRDDGFSEFPSILSINLMP